MDEEWNRDDGSGDVVGRVQKKLRACRTALSRWSKNVFTGREKLIQDKTEQIRRLQLEEDKYKVEELREVRKELGIMLEHEDQNWRQRAKLQRYQKGDKKMKYFHACATERKRRGFVTKIKDQNQVLRYGKVGIEQAFTDYFQGIYSSISPTSEVINAVVANVQTKVTLQVRENLGRVYTVEEVKLALNQMSPLSHQD